jgi:hypothetical protein
MSEREIGNLLAIAVGEQPGNDDQRPGLALLHFR